VFEFIKNNEEDFIKYKTNLYHNEAKNDPIKLAELISDIVASIAIINNDIKQAVYLKECSKILDIDEATLYKEIAKIKRKKIEEKNRTNQTELPQNEIKLTPPIPQFVDNQYYETHEVEILRILLLYGNNILYEHTDEYEQKTVYTVAPYIISQLQNDNLELKNLLYKKIFHLVEEYLANGIELKPELFTKNPDIEISKIAANIIAPKPELSQIWEKLGSAILNEEKTLLEILEDLFVRYKLKILKEAKNECEKQLTSENVINNTETKKEILEKIKELDKIIKYFGENYNIVLF